MGAIKKQAAAAYGGKRVGNRVAADRAIIKTAVIQFDTAAGIDGGIVGEQGVFNGVFGRAVQATAMLGAVADDGTAADFGGVQIWGPGMAINTAAIIVSFVISDCAAVNFTAGSTEIISDIKNTAAAPAADII